MSNIGFVIVANLTAEPETYAESVPFLWEGGKCYIGLQGSGSPDMDIKIIGLLRDGGTEFFAPSQINLQVPPLLTNNDTDYASLYVLDAPRGNYRFKITNASVSTAMSLIAYIVK